MKRTMARHRKGGDLRYRQAEVMGRLYWDAAHPSPWVVFPNITEYRPWATAVRRARPGTKTEYLVNIHWTPAALLSAVASKANSEMGTR